MVGIIFKSAFEFEAQFSILGMDLQTRARSTVKGAQSRGKYRRLNQIQRRASPLPAVFQLIVLDRLGCRFETSGCYLLKEDVQTREMIIIARGAKSMVISLETTD